MTPVRSLGIVGSRGVCDMRVLLQALGCMGIAPEDLDRVVSGGAHGVDTLAEELANEHLHRQTIYRVPPNLSGPAFTQAARARNQRIVDDSDALLAIPCAHSKGTYDTIRRAVSKGIPIVVWPAMVCGCKR